MKAIQLEKPGKFELIQIPEANSPGPGEALVRVHRVGICGTDISGYLGKKDTFDEAIADFAVAYADQSERDHETLTKAVRAGKLEVFIEGP